MGTLIRMKAEVNNPELPVITEQGFLPYYTGRYVNRLADKGITLTQAEINAVTTFTDSLKNAGVINKIGTFYPFMGNVNVPLLGDKELEFTDTTSTNTNLDFVGNKLRGVKKFETMNNVYLSELTNPNFGFMVGGSIISKIPADNEYPNLILSFRNKQYNSSIPSVQFRITIDNSKHKFSIFNFYDPSSSSIVSSVGFSPELEVSNNLHNFSFAHGLTNVAPPYSSGFISYNRTANRDGVSISNTVGNDLSSYVRSENIGNFSMYASSSNNYDSVTTSLVLFNEILSAQMSKDFVNALDTFTAAVGKTVAVG